MPAEGVPPRFWARRRVFVTGHTGFKGTWLCAWLLAQGAQVRGYALTPVSDGVPPGRAPFFDEMGLAGRMDHILGDIRDGAALAAAMADFRPEVVIHMAAQPLVRRSYVDPVETYSTNVMGTVCLLQACRGLPDLRAVVIVTSDKCYENREQIWGYREADPMGGHDPYSSSKGCAELVTAAFRASFFPADRLHDHGVVVCSGRAGNVIGGGDWSLDRLVPDAMRAVAAGAELTLRKPGAVRPWQHVLDPVSGYLRLAEVALTTPQRAIGGWNFGPSDDLTLTVAEVIAALAARIGDRFRWRINPAPDDPHEATLLRLDCTAARTWLGWTPRFGLEAMIGMTADWYRADDPDERRDCVRRQLALAG